MNEPKKELVDVLPFWYLSGRYILKGTCLACGNSWELSKEEVITAARFEIAYSVCCQQPASLVKVRKK